MSVLNGVIRKYSCSPLKYKLSKPKELLLFFFKDPLSTKETFKGKQKFRNMRISFH